jgi:flagellar hook assembly protein FlgD
MQNIEKVLQQQVDAGGLTTLAMKADLGASFIGRNVIAAGNKISLTEQGPAKAIVDIGTGGGKTVVTIKDKAGKEIATKNLGWRDAGRQTLDLGDLPAGTYSYEVTVTGAGDSDIPVQTYTSGIVDSVSFQNGTVILKSGDLSFPLDNVVEVERAPAGASVLAAIRGARVLPSSMESAKP